MYAEINGNSINLYGTIWSGDGQYIVSSLKKSLAAKGDLDIHIHSPGGSVIDGNLIYNAIAGSKATVTMVNDGLAASMAAMLMLAGSKAKMAENAFMMIHAPSGYQSGNAKDFENTAKVLRAMEGNFIKKLAARTGKTEADLKDWMNGDNWFTADEALTDGLISEVIDSIIADNADIAAYQDLKLSAELFSAYDKKPETEEEETTPQNRKKQTPPKNREMKLSAEALKGLGLSAEATDGEINAAIEARDKEFAALKTANADKAKKEVEDFVADLLAKGKILGSEKEAVIADATANLEATKRAYAKVPVKGSLTKTQNTPTSEGGEEDRSAWTHAQWREKDTAGLLAMKKTDPDAYKALCVKAGIDY